MNERQIIIEQIVAANDIVEVVGSYFPLNADKSSYKALCPFHHEQTPSFEVDPVTQTFQCTVCDLHGDVARFVMEYERVDRPAAIKMLAARAHIALHVSELTDSAATLIEVLAKTFPLPARSPTENELRQTAATPEGLLLALPAAHQAGHAQLRDEFLQQIRARGEEMVAAAIELMSRSR
jgi:DNA primase